jgi:hypothetical protein
VARRAALIVVLIIFRLSLYFYPLVFEFRQFELFDPAVYGTNLVNRTLGDLLINSLLFSWITVFAWSKLGNQMDLLRRVKGAGKWLIAIVALLVLVVSTFVLASTISSLVAIQKYLLTLRTFLALISIV